MSSIESSNAFASMTTTTGRTHLPLLRVLTLGDGNFSFSAAIVQMHQGKRQRQKKKKAASNQSNGSSTAPGDSAHASVNELTPSPSHDSFHPTHQLQLVATSFDSATDLHAKYTEAAKLIDKIIGHKKAQMNQVEHDVDATQLEKTLRPKLEKSIAIADESSSISTSTVASTPLLSTTASQQFDVIIFNHPHSGCENLALHGSLLAHFFHSASTFLQTDFANGTQQLPQIHVTLCMKQPEDWELLKHAARHGFHLLSRSEFLEEHYPSYETKRHHVNKTFKNNTIQRMELFIFERKSELVSPTDSSNSRPTYHSMDQDPSFSHNLMSHVIPLPTFHPTLPLEDLRSGAKDEESKEDGSTAFTPVSRLLLTDFVCPCCQKGFASERGLFYHQTNVHSPTTTTPDESNLSSNPFPSTAPATFMCSECQPLREFKNAEALQKHQLARHTKLETILVSTTDATSSTQLTTTAMATSTPKPHPSSSNDPASNPFECPICPLRFPTSDSLELHLVGGVPPVTIPTAECPTCGRIFPNQRGLNQHLLSMSATPEKHIRIVLSSASVSEVGLPGGGSSGQSRMKRLRQIALNSEKPSDAHPTASQQSVIQRLGVKLNHTNLNEPMTTPNLSQ